MEFELSKLRLLAANGNDSGNGGNEENGLKKSRYDLKKMMPKFDPEENDISLYLVMFERQAKRANLHQSEWVSVLLTILPTDIVQLIMREPEQQAYDYAYIKGILLKRFKLSPEKFRIKFVQSQKHPQTTWRDFAFELRNYFEEWIADLEVTDFELLKELMITDQMSVVPKFPKVQKDFKSPAVVNRVQETEEDFLAPYTTMAKVNGFDLPVLRDSGASIDVICNKYITPSMLTGETVWANIRLMRHQFVYP
ncbi:uncharacterized protein LOC118186112 [Stegodyphus dumicola]|uniref:uncharacterized protein LOC118186112 n=1 Tax=Stegodyphus dumicola TaxID=202533 RepID=UPI0015ACEB87|nr:uncharacterized protein LOC118186112 [Stegodyphus dumicola]